MSLLNSASLVVTPNAYKEGTLYSVIPNTTLGDMTVVRATTATRVNSAGLIESVANNVPRLDYSNGTCPSLLVEPQRTNLVTYSEQFDNADWTKQSGVSVTANQTISPDGTQNADLVVGGGSSGIFQSGKTVSTTVANTKSVYLKGVSGGEVVRLQDPYQTLGYTVCTLTTSWQRFTLSEVQSGGFAGLWVTLIPSGGIYIWGAQLEDSTYATSYIPTTSAAVTRNADVISKTGISSLIGQTEGVMFIDYNYDAKPDTNGNIPMVIYDGSNEAYIFITSGGSVRLELYDGGVLQCLLTTSIGAVGRKKIAFAYKQNDFVGYMNGVQIANDTSGTVGAMSNLYVGSYYTANYNANGGINSAILFPTRLTNAELISLTTL